MQVKDEILYDTCNNTVKVIDVTQNGIILEKKRVVTVSYNNGRNKEQQIKMEKIVGFASDLGIKYFFSYSDYEDHKKCLIRDKRYFFNRENIEKFFKNEAETLANEIKKTQPQGILIDTEEKENIILEYYDTKKEMTAEQSFSLKYSSMNYFGRIDLDTHYYRKNFEYYWDEHYYQKIYITNKNYQYAGNGVHFVNWRSPIATMYYDTEKTIMTREVDVDVVNLLVRGVRVHDRRNVYEHELMLKRSFSSLKPIKFQNTYICGGDDLYHEGSADPFLMQVLMENRKQHKITDIIKTIQSNQNNIIRTAKEKSIIVQGCAGSGKTMVLLHRLSYLKFNQLLPGKNRTKIITPNDYFSAFINDLSNTLELDDIERVTMFDYFVSVCKKYQKQYSIAVKNIVMGEKTNKREAEANAIALEYYTKNKIVDYGYNGALEDIIALDENVQNLYKEKMSAFREEIALSRIEHIAKRFYISFPTENTLSDKVFLDEVYDIIANAIPRNNAKLREKISEIQMHTKVVEEKLEVLSEIVNLVEARINLSKKTRIEFSNFIDNEISNIKQKKENLSWFDFRQKRELDELIKRMELLRHMEDFEHSKRLSYEAYKTIDSLETKFVNDVLLIISSSVALLNYENKFPKTEENNEIQKDFRLLSEIINKAITYSKNDNAEICDSFKAKNMISEFEWCIKSLCDHSKMLIDSWENRKKQLKDQEQEKTNLVVNEKEKTILNHAFVELSRRGLFVIDTFLDLRANVLRKEDNHQDCFILNKNEACALVYLYVLHCSAVYEADLAIFIDEGQDYSYFEYKVMRLVNGNECALNVFGDVNQRIEFSNTMPDWRRLKELLSAEQYTLNENYRNTIEITDYVNQELDFKVFPIGIHGPMVSYIDKKNLDKEFEKIWKNNEKLRIAFISLDENYLKSVKSSLEAEEFFVGTVIGVKGLEFDLVFVHDKDMNVNERYISYTRALEKLIIVRE